jgi:hypothetical protein
LAAIRYLVFHFVNITEPASAEGFNDRVLLVFFCVDRGFVNVNTPLHNVESRIGKAATQVVHSIIVFCC